MNDRQGRVGIWARYDKWSCQGVDLRVVERSVVGGRETRCALDFRDDGLVTGFAVREYEKCII